MRLSPGWAGRGQSGTRLRLGGARPPATHITRPHQNQTHKNSGINTMGVILFLHLLPEVVFRSNLILTMTIFIQFILWLLSYNETVVIR